MRRLLHVLAFLALAVGAQAHAASFGEWSVVLSNVALNASAGARTFSLLNPSGNYVYASIESLRTRVAGTDFTLTCLATAQPGAVPTGARTTCTYDATGVCTSVTAVLKSNTTATEVLPWTVSVAGWARQDCTVASTGAGGSDFVTTSVRMWAP